VSKHLINMHHVTANGKNGHFTSENCTRWLFTLVFFAFRRTFILCYRLSNRHIYLETARNKKMPISESITKIQSFFIFIYIDAIVVCENISNRCYSEKISKVWALDRNERGGRVSRTGKSCKKITQSRGNRYL
jgi:hypothetical protein